MSFILDALRKSESERQQQATPSLADARYDVPAKPANRWIPVLALILAANVLIMAFIFLKDSTDADTQTLASAGPIEPAAAFTADKVRPLSKEVPTTPAPVPVAKTPPAKSIAPATRRIEPLSETPVSIKPEPAPVQSAAYKLTSSNVIGEGLPSLEQLVLAGMISLPPLHLDMHVYSIERPQRFVFINMSKYKEGEHLAEGPTLEEITETGAVLNHQGNRFFLDRE